MSSDIKNVVEELKVLDIWHDNGNIDPFKLSPLFMNLTKNGELDKAQNIINLVKNSGFYDKIRVRINTHQNQLDGIRRVLEDSVVQHGFDKVNLVPYDVKNQNEVFDIRDAKFFEEGLYKKRDSFWKINKFNEDFSYASDALRIKLSDAGFARSINSSVPEKIRVASNVKVHGVPEFYAISDPNNRYDEDNVSRLARLTNINFVSRSEPIHIKKALVLPFDSASVNYYHNISEMVYGIRYAEFLDCEYKIVYTEDRFGALEFICQKLGIDLNRLVSIKDRESIRIDKALHPSSVGYSWNKKIFDFFSRLRDETSGEDVKVYISRMRSKRAFDNEEAVEDYLKSKGFLILRAEEVTFKDQVELFSKVKVLVAGHGAGLTNMLFMAKGGKIIELFTESYVKPDFYFRSIHNAFNYKALVANNNMVPISELHELL
ncbi:glycosyltransferase family 61 protein [Salinicola salarius]|uniref:glycosyltransferase family 61 protein n=1 Tax=Salinicola salarius TaxID=430457 RepID=UPI0023E3B670|nr:glycosyltransferase family 61 protein [Salinicola salarius]MDF3918792.1 glycosyltransferase family 61 protein [Salinicola salarius]